jgi:hypothetical protein
MSVLAALAGALTATSLVMIAYALRPPPLRLDVALARIRPTPLEPDHRPVPPPSGRLGAWLVDLARPSGVLAIPHTDLALLQRTPGRFMVTKLVLLLAGLGLPHAVATALTLVADLSWTIPAMSGLLLGIVLFFVPDLTIRSAARTCRREFRYAVISYLQLVILERQAGASVNTALERTARIADSWPFTRIHDALTRARRAQQPPWRALADLGEQIGVHDLVDLAYTAEIAAEHGAGMHKILTAKVAAMHHETSAAVRSEANVRTTTMWVPVSLLMLGYVILIGFPFLYRLIHSG